MYFIDFHQVGFLSDTYLRAVGHDCPIHAHLSYASSQMLMMMIMVMVMLLLIMVIIISTMIAPFSPFFPLLFHLLWWPDLKRFKLYIL